MKIRPFSEENSAYSFYQPNPLVNHNSVASTIRPLPNQMSLNQFQAAPVRNQSYEPGGDGLLFTNRTHQHRIQNQRKKNICELSPYCSILFLVTFLFLVCGIVSIPVALALTFRTSMKTTTTTPPSCFKVIPSQPSNSWVMIGNMSHSRQHHTATFLSQDSSIFLAGGHNGSVALRSTEKYVTTTGCFVQTSDMRRARYYHTADVLQIPSRTVILAGGFDVSALNVADLYDSSSGNMSMITMTAGRYLQTSALLTSSDLVLIGGLTVNTINTADLLSTASLTSFTLVPRTMISPRHHHTTTRLGSFSDIFLIAGGLNIWTPLASLELYNGSSNSFIPLASALPIPRCRHTATYIPFLNQVLLVGGSDASNPLDTMVVFDATTMSVLPSTARLVNRRMFHTATLLPNGKILIVGGENATTSLSSCELIDPNNGNYSSTLAATLHIGRGHHTASLVSTNGRDSVLVCGGSSTSLGVLRSCEIYFI